MIPVKYILTLILCIIIYNYMRAQSSETEFTKGWLLAAKLSSGVTTNFKGAAPDLYTGGVALNPQVTAITGLLRIGANGGLVYNNKKLSGLFGPMIALKLKTFTINNLGSIGNVHLLAEANWGTNKQQMVGGGLGIEMLKRAHIGITAQRDYKLNAWWMQVFLAIRLNRFKQVQDEYTQ